MGAPHEGTDPPPDMGDPSAEVPDPPAEMPDPPATLVLNTADATQEVVSSADPSSSAPRPSAFCPAEVQPAKPKMMMPTFRRRTPALPVSTTHPGPTHPEGLGKASDPDAPTDVVEASDNAAEDMILDEPENGDHLTMSKRPHCICTVSRRHHMMLLCIHQVMSCYHDIRVVSGRLLLVWGGGGVPH